MTTHLLDANVLIAVTFAEHVHHRRCSEWLATTDRFALCPAVEGALARFLLRVGESTDTVRGALSQIRSLEQGEWWADDLSYAHVDFTGVRGHRQLTDVYLAGLASAHGGLLATLDQGIAALRPQQTLLVPEVR